MLHHVHRVATHRHFIPLVIVSTLVGLSHQRIPDAVAYIEEKKVVLMYSAQAAIRDIASQLKSQLHR